MPLPSGEVLNFISGGTYYAATSCLALDQYLTQGNEAVFSVPNRHVLMYVEGKEITSPTAKLMALEAQQALEDGPGSITTELFSWNSGSISAYSW